MSNIDNVELLIDDADIEDLLSDFQLDTETTNSNNIESKIIKDLFDNKKENKDIAKKILKEINRLEKGKKNKKNTLSKRWIYITVGWMFLWKIGSDNKTMIDFDYKNVKYLLNAEVVIKNNISYIKALLKQLLKETQYDKKIIDLLVSNKLIQIDKNPNFIRKKDIPEEEIIDTLWKNKNNKDLLLSLVENKLKTYIFNGLYDWQIKQSIFSGEEILEDKNIKNIIKKIKINQSSYKNVVSLKTWYNTYMLNDLMNKEYSNISGSDNFSEIEKKIKKIADDYNKNSKLLKGISNIKKYFLMPIITADIEYKQLSNKNARNIFMNTLVKYYIWILSNKILSLLKFDNKNKIEQTIKKATTSTITIPSKGQSNKNMISEIIDTLYSDFNAFFNYEFDKKIFSDAIKKVLKDNNDNLWNVIIKLKKDKEISKVSFDIDVLEDLMNIILNNFINKDWSFNNTKEWKIIYDRIMWLYFDYVNGNKTENPDFFKSISSNNMLYFPNKHLFLKKKKTLSANDIIWNTAFSDEDILEVNMETIDNISDKVEEVFNNVKTLWQDIYWKSFKYILNNDEELKLSLSIQFKKELVLKEKNIDPKKINNFIQKIKNTIKEKIEKYKEIETKNKKEQLDIIEEKYNDKSYILDKISLRMLINDNYYGKIPEEGKMIKEFIKNSDKKMRTYQWIKFK